MDDPPLLAVIGLHRSGSSALAGVLDRLGVHFGPPDELGGHENRHRGGFEYRPLIRLCEAAMRFPTTEVVMPRAELAAGLAGISAELRRQAARLGRPLAGMKYPHLCVLGEVLAEVVPDVRWVAIERPVDESIRSLADRSARAKGFLAADGEACAALQRRLAAARDALLARRDVVTVRYHELLDAPRRVVDDLAADLGLRPSAEQVAAAVAMVEPAYAEHRSGGPGGEAESQSARRRSST